MLDNLNVSQKKKYDSESSDSESDGSFDDEPPLPLAERLEAFMNRR
jgi:hypothetical protein